MRMVIAASTAFHLRHLARELLNRGWEVEFHSYLPRWKTRQYGLPDRHVVSHFAALLPWSGLALLRGAPVHAVRERLFALIDRRTAQTMSRADVFVGLSAVAVESARQAAKDGALVLIERGSSHILHQRDIARAARLREPSRLCTNRELASYEVADRVVVPSRFAATTFIAHGFVPQRLQVVPLGADLNLFRPSTIPRSGPVRALYAGVWSRRKGCDLLAALLGAVPELELLHVGIVGDAPLPDSSRFRSLGYRSQPELAQIMRERHLFLFPSRDDGFGMVMAEALASGMRVVASDACGGPDLADMIDREYVSIVPANDLVALIAATRRKVEAIAADPGRCAAPAEQIERLAWSGYGARYAAMLDKLIAEPR